MKRIYLRIPEGDDQWIRPMNTPEFADAMAQRGHMMVKQIDEANIVIQDHRLTEVIHPCTIIFQRLDAGELLQSTVDHFDPIDDVKGYLLPFHKPFGITPYVQGPVGIETKPAGVLTTMPWAEVPQIRFKRYQKEFDVTFLGTGHYGPVDGSKVHDYPIAHRQCLMDNWYEIQGHKTVFMTTGHPRPMSWQQAFEITAKSKVVISPWGMCEISWRDWEAVLGAAVIVKPDSGYVTSWNPFLYYQRCNSNYENLKRSVDIALELFDEQQGEIRNQATRLLRDCGGRNRLQNLAKELIRVIGTILD